MTTIPPTHQFSSVPIMLQTVDHACLGPKQLKWCRNKLKHNSVKIFKLMEANPTTRAQHTQHKDERG